MKCQSIVCTHMVFLSFVDIEGAVFEKLISLRWHYNISSTTCICLITSNKEKLWEYKQHQALPWYSDHIQALILLCWSSWAYYGQHSQFNPLDGVIPLSLQFGQTLEVLEALEMKEMFLEHYAWIVISEYIDLCRNCTKYCDAMTIKDTFSCPVCIMPVST